MNTNTDIVPIDPVAEECRFIADQLSLFRLCDMSVCQRARACRGHARRCLDTLGEKAPEPAYAFAEVLLAEHQGVGPVGKPRETYLLEAASYDAWNMALIESASFHAKRLR